MQYTLLILQYAFSVITRKQSDKLATIQRIRCHAYDRDGADCTFSQDLKFLPASVSIYIYIIFERGLNVALKNSQFSLVFPFKPGNPGVHFNTAATFYKYQQTLQVYYKQSYLNSRSFFTIIFFLLYFEVFRLFFLNRIKIDSLFYLNLYLNL